MASPPAPVTSRWAVLPLWYVTGKTSLGVKKRNALTGMAAASAMATITSKGWSTAR